MQKSSGLFVDVSDPNSMVCYFALPKKNQEEMYYNELHMHLIFKKKKKIYIWRTYDKIV